MQLVKDAPWLPTTDTSDCTYCCNRTRSPISQSNERKAAPREIKRPHVSNLTKPLVTVPPPVIYILSKNLKNSPCSLNIQVKLTPLTSLASISTSVLLDSGATSVGRILVCCMICLQDPDSRVRALISTILPEEG